MQTREQRRLELESLANTKPGCCQILGEYLFAIGRMPAAGSYVRQDMIPAILDAEFPSREEPRLNAAKT
jgi:hypothetical protein